MKKLLSLIFLMIVATSCSVSDDSQPTTGYALLAVESVAVAETYPVGVTSEIMVTYTRPTDCYIFDGFYVQSEGFSHIIAVQALEMLRNDCIEDMTSFEVPLDFRPTIAGEYMLKFYAGSPNNVPQYLEYSVIVE